MPKKLEQFYMKNNEELNKAIGEKNYQLFDELMATKLCMDVHVFGKNTIAIYRQLFSFTNCLLICTGSGNKPSNETFSDMFSFLAKGVNPGS